MKKSLLLAAAALLTASSTFAADLYIVGANINGSEQWGPGSDNKMTETSTNVYEWTGTVLGSSFKFNNGGWDTPEYNIGTSGDKLTLNEPFKYFADANSTDIAFNGLKEVQNPKVVLDMTAGTVTVTGEGVASEDDGTFAYYIVGDNANGHNWSVKEEDCKFTDMGNGIWEWQGQKLGTGFKITAGAWGDHEMCSNGSNIAMNTPYYVASSGGNIGFDGFTMLLNPVVQYNENENTITLTGGEKEGVYKWYIYNLNGVGGDTPDAAGNNELAPTDVEGIFMLKGFDIYETAGTFKIASTGWAQQYGTNDPENNYIDPTHLEVYLDVVGSDGDINYELEPGYYDITFDANELIVTFAPASEEGGVDIIGAEDGTPVYFNLQGQRVANPDKGIYVRVLNGKALKVVK